MGGVWPLCRQGHLSCPAVCLSLASGGPQADQQPEPRDLTWHSPVSSWLAHSCSTYRHSPRLQTGRRCCSHPTWSRWFLGAGTCQLLGFAMGRGRLSQV